MTKATKKPDVTPIKKDISEIQEPASKPLSRFEEMEQMFEEFFSRPWFRQFHIGHPPWGQLPAPFDGRTPYVDVIDRNKEVFIKAELPGVEKDDVELSITKNSVKIKGSTRTEKKEEKGDYFRSEISQGSFSRTLSLPADIDTDKAKAKFKNGVLKLTIPKLKSSKHKSVKIE